MEVLGGISLFFREITLTSNTERKGFEPLVALTTSVFKTDTIDQLCHLS